MAQARMQRSAPMDDLLPLTPWPQISLPMTSTKEQTSFCETHASERQKVANRSPRKFRLLQPRRMLTAPVIILP